MDSTRVILIIDMISTWDFEGAEQAADGAGEVVDAINRLRGLEGPSVVFANDLSEGFHGSRERAFELALAGSCPHLVRPLEPKPTEDFIHKGQHSAFYGTPLAHLLEIRDAGEVILAGQVTEQCVLYTALDAHVRGFEITVVTDAVLSLEEHLGAAALEMMRENMGAKLVTSREVPEGPS